MNISPEEARNTLMRKLHGKDENLAILVRNATDEGKETTDEIRHSRGRSKKSHKYRKIEPFTDEEALQVALKVLQRFFIEGPLFTNEIIKYLSDTSENHDIPEIQIEGDSPLTQVPNEEIEEQRRNLASLKELIAFPRE